jgi:hypothetical protein
MEAPINLKIGLEILDPFFKQNDFRFNKYENYKGSDERFTFVTYKNNHKVFHLGYYYSIGHIIYQFDDFKVGHDFYLDRLGFGQQIKFYGTQTEDKLAAFSNVLYDFQFLVDDFFQGECLKLQEFSRLKENIITEYDKKAREGYNLEFDELRIGKARQEFRMKDFKKSLELYHSIEYRELINPLDKKIIEFCERHI